MMNKETRNLISQRKQVVAQRIRRLREILTQNPENADNLRTQIRFLERDLIELDYRTPAQRAAGWK